MIPRDYQDYAVNSIFDYFAIEDGNPIVAMPTGTGKSIVIAEFLRRALALFPHTRVMKLTHVKELIEQNYDKLRAVWPNAPVGIYSSGLGKKELGYPITFGGVGSVVRVDPKAFGRIDLLLIDECHLLSPNANTMYQKVIAGLKEINPNLKVVGFTATDYRLGQGRLDGGLFTRACVDMTKLNSFNWFFEQGYLCKVVPRATKTEIDVSSVGLQGGEFKGKELQDASNQEEVTHKALTEMIALGQDRHKWLIFTTGIDHTLAVADMLENLFGIPTSIAHSKLKGKDRDTNIADFVHGDARAMVNPNILTTGFDYPNIDLIGGLRATQSTGLWVQMLGRGTRPVYEPGFDLTTQAGRLESIGASPKQDCLVLDYAGNSRRLGPINDPHIPQKKKKGAPGSAPVKICPACRTYNPASVRFCEHCQEEFPKNFKLDNHASTAMLLAEEEIQTAWFDVDRVTYATHKKEGKPPSIKVTYHCGLRMFREWVCLEHGNISGKRARDWWRARHPHQPPETTAEAICLLNQLAVPSKVNIWLKKNYSEVIKHEFPDE